MRRMAGIGTSPSDLREAEEPVYMLTRRRGAMPPAPAQAPSVPPEESVVRMTKRRGADGSIEAWTSLETSEAVPDPREAVGLRPAPESRASGGYDQAWDDDEAGDETSDVRFIRR